MQGPGCVSQPISEEERAAHVQAVGRYLRAEGGDDLLAEAYEMVRGLGGDMKVFDRYWRARGMDNRAAAKPSRSLA